MDFIESTLREANFVDDNPQCGCATATNQSQFEVEMASDAWAQIEGQQESKPLARLRSQRKTCKVSLFNKTQIAAQSARSGNPPPTAPGWT